MKYYVLDDNKNLVEAFDKEGFLGLLEQAIEQGTLENIDEDSAVASKFRSAYDGKTYYIAFCTQAEYEEAERRDDLIANCYYFILDDTSADELQEHMNQIDADHEQVMQYYEAADERITVLENKKVTGTIEYRQTGQAFFELVGGHPNIRFYAYEEESTSVVQRWTYKQVNVEVQQSYVITSGSTSWSNKAYYADGTAVAQGTTLHYEYFK